MLRKSSSDGAWRYATIDYRQRDKQSIPEDDCRAQSGPPRTKVWCATPARMHGCAEAGRVGKTAAVWAVLNDAPAASSGFSYLLRTSTAELFKKYKIFDQFRDIESLKNFFLFLSFTKTTKIRPNKQTKHRHLLFFG